MITIPVDGGHGSTTKLPKHYTGGKMVSFFFIPVMCNVVIVHLCLGVQLEEISLEMTEMKDTLMDTLKDYHTEQVIINGVGIY